MAVTKEVSTRCHVNCLGGSGFFELFPGGLWYAEPQTDRRRWVGAAVPSVPDAVKDKHAMKQKKPSRHGRLPYGLNILYEDDDLLAVNKPAGLLTVETVTEKNRTVYEILTEYVKKGQARSRNQVFTVHRLDQWTSGVILFAKSRAVMDCLKDRWDETRKTYLTVVHGQLEEKEGEISSFLAENSRNHVYSTPDRTKGKLARTAYKVLKETPRYSLLEINLLTGRKNQIRVHMADLGHPVVGDRKYGDDADGFPRFALHSWFLRFPHPRKNETIVLAAEVPTCFRGLVGAF